MKPRLFRMLLFAGIAYMVSSCATTKYMKADEELLVKNEIELIESERIPNKSNLKYELTTLLKQTPNSKWLWFFKVPVWAYYKHERTKAQAADENWLERQMRKLAVKRIIESPAIYDEQLAQASATAMRNFLQNRGYFNAEATFEKRYTSFKKVEESGFIPGREVEITYIVEPHKLFRIDTVIFKSEDEKIYEILQQIAPETELKEDLPVDGQLYDREVGRITSYLRNHGYAYFTPNYVAPLEADTLNNKAKLWLEVLPPASDENHRQYTFGQVVVAPYFNPVLDSLELRDSVINGKIYQGRKGMPFWVRPKVLDESIYIDSGRLYNQAQVDKTNRQLTNLGVYKFVSIRELPDTAQPQQLNFEIDLIPRKKWEIGADLEPNFTERSFALSRLNLFGLSTNLSLQNRNLFRGAELFLANGSLGFEMNFDAIGKNVRALFNTLDGRLQFDLFMPRFYDYLGSYRLLRNMGLLKQSFYTNLKEQSPTRISLGYNYLSIFNFYDYHLFNASYGFDLQTKNARYIINHLAVDFLNPTTQPQFQQLLDSNLFLRNSFGDQFFTGILFRDFNYIFNSRTNRFGESHYIQLNTELSGGEVFLANKLYNQLAGKEVKFKFGDEVEYSQYVKAEFDARYFKKFTPRRAIALRFNIGIASSFGFSDEVPYVKQFYVGGPQSLRAWGARGLGPGSYQDPLTEDRANRLLFYQTGTFKIELNAEYRFDMFKIWGMVTEGALFIDMGNIWTLKPDDRPGGQLQWSPQKRPDGELVGANFFKEFAIGTGYGFRFDFNYFLLRLDLGYKIKNPYKKPIGGEGSRTSYLEYNSLDELRLDDINYNIGINYPF